MIGWKILTSDFRPPVQSGDPLFDGKTFPRLLPSVELDQSDRECGRGWNFVADIETGFKIAGLWRSGKPNAVIQIEAEGAIRRRDKLRARSLTLLRHATDDEIHAALLRFSKPFGAHQEAMAEEQWLWWQALKRPSYDARKVEAYLREALVSRALDWKLKQFSDAGAARAAWDAWDARDAWAAWSAGAAWGAWSAGAARAAWDAWSAGGARAAGDAWDPWAAGASWDAGDALTVSFAARSGWIELKHDHLTVGIRDAYRNGLAIAVATGTNELGWAMEAPK